LLAGSRGFRLPESLGFRDGITSVHTSRTMMLKDLEPLLDRVAPDARLAGYTAAIVQDNALGKPTQSTRGRTAKRLAELYALDPTVPLFRVFRYYWAGDFEGRPMLAFPLAAARDPLLRDCTPEIQAVPYDQHVAPGQIADWLEEKYPGRFLTTTRQSTAQNLASSWAQAGYLRGKVAKHRVQPVVTPVVVAYALALGYFCGPRGQRLLESTWTGFLDRPASDVMGLAAEGSKQGWLELKAAGSVVEITFPGILRSSEASSP
jgi:hypothetical protein